MNESFLFPQTAEKYNIFYQKNAFLGDLHFLVTKVQALSLAEDWIFFCIQTLTNESAQFLVVSAFPSLGSIMF